MTSTVTVPIDLKAEALSANARTHWSVRQTRTRLLRDKAWVLTCAAHVPVMNRAHLTVRVTWPDRRRRDVANLSPTIKALIDGMVTDALLLQDDDDTHLIGPDLRVNPEISGRPGLAVLAFEWDEIVDGAS